MTDAVSQRVSDLERQLADAERLVVATRERATRLMQRLRTLADTLDDGNRERFYEILAEPPQRHYEAAGHIREREHQ